LSDELYSTNALVLYGERSGISPTGMKRFRHAVMGLVGERVELSDIERVESLIPIDAWAAHDQAQAALEAAISCADTVTYHRWLLVMGVAQARLGFTEEGAGSLRRVRAWADEHRQRTLWARSHLELSGMLGRVGEPALTLEHAVQAVELLDDYVDPRLRGDHLLSLADALGLVGSYDEAITRYHEAARLLAPWPERLLAVLNNLAYTQYEGDRVQDSVDTAERLVVELAGHGLPMLRNYRETIACAFLAVGRFHEAAAVLEPMCGDAEGREDCAGFVTSLLTLSRVRRLQGGFDEAQDCLDRAGALIHQYALTGRHVDAMREQAELDAARGQFESAFEVFAAFRQAEAELHAVERQSRTRTLHAIFEATEARRQSDHYRELSLRDPLTGLRNRRHLDNALTELLDQVQNDGASLTIGLVDLDHFKRVNDTRSHAVGDEVLRVVAGILQRSADRTENGLAIRMGGEEFLILLPETAHDQGIELLESLCQELGTHPWDEITGGIPITASIGAATAPDDALDRRTLLQVADQNLYRAKHDGRDRVVS
jgi:diguanylate cyclase (GGDEF)-like protein